MTPASVDVGPTQREQEFITQSEKFIEFALAASGANSLSECSRSSERPAHCLVPVLLDDYRHMTREERAALVNAYQSQYGVAYFIALNAADPARGGHPLFEIADQLTDDLQLLHPLPHPLEGHPEAVSRFGQADGTVKIYNLAGRGGAAGYREQAETAEVFAMHHDGLGSGGTVQTAVLYMDSAPLWGGFTFFQNIARLALELAHTDIDAFRSLFLPDALTIIRPRGKGAIKVVTPVLFLNEFSRPQSFFRVASGEYTVTWKTGRPALDRACAYLRRHAEPFSNGSSFLHFTGKGHGCLIRNEQVAHGRTDFRDWPAAGLTRVLSRKWFMTGFQHSTYKHVPGMFIAESYRSHYPELFGLEFLEGEWSYDPARDCNTRVK
jgi:Taurine catabolism dioxygenase TauD, TfdA family